MANEILCIIVGMIIGSLLTTFIFALVSIGDTNTNIEEEDREQEAFLKELAEMRKTQR